MPEYPTLDRDPVPEALRDKVCEVDRRVDTNRFPSGPASGLGRELGFWQLAKLDAGRGVSSLAKYFLSQVPTSDTTSLNQGSRLSNPPNQLAVVDCLSFSRLYITASSHVTVSKVPQTELQTLMVRTLEMDPSFWNARRKSIQFFDRHSVPFRSTRAFCRNASCSYGCQPRL